MVAPSGCACRLAGPAAGPPQVSSSHQVSSSFASCAACLACSVRLGLSCASTGAGDGCAFWDASRLQSPNRSRSTFIGRAQELIRQEGGQAPRPGTLSSEHVKQLSPAPGCPAPPSGWPPDPRLPPTSGSERTPQSRPGGGAAAGPSAVTRAAVGDGRPEGAAPHLPVRAASACGPACCVTHGLPHIRCRCRGGRVAPARVAHACRSKALGPRADQGVREGLENSQRDVVRPAAAKLLPRQKSAINNASFPMPSVRSV